MSKTTDILKRLRDGGFSQTEIAKLTGIAQPRLSRWESGRVPAGADDALALLELEQLTLSPPQGQSDAQIGQCGGAQGLEAVSVGGDASGAAHV